MYILLAALLTLAGCQCNEPAPATPKVEHPKGKAKSKTGKRKMGKQKRPQVKRVPTQVYLLDPKKVEAGEADPLVPVNRKVGEKDVPKNTVWVLFRGLKDEEKEQGLELKTNGAEGFEAFKIEDGVASLKLRGACTNDGGTITIYDHIAKSLKRFDEIEFVKVYDPEGTTQEPEGKSDSRPACLEP